MGGEYLPDYLPTEVEVARIDLQSIMRDAISIRACRDPKGIRYRVVDLNSPEPEDGDAFIGRAQVGIAAQRRHQFQ